MQRVVLVIVGVCVALVAGEAGLRFAKFGEPRATELVRGEDGLPVRPRNQVVRERHGVMAGTASDAEEGSAGGVTIRFNRDGFRGADFGVADVSGDGASATATRRVVMIGDSFVFGSTLREDETLGVQVAAGLVGATGENWQAVNLGVPGIVTSQEAMIAETWFARLRPAAAVLVMVDNDVAEDPWTPSAGEGCGVEMTPREALWRGLLRDVYLTRVLAGLLVTQDVCTAHNRCQNTALDGPTLLMRCFRRSLLRIAEAARVHGVAMVATLYPVPWGYWRAGEAHPAREHYGRFLDEAEAAGLRVVDVEPALRELGGDGARTSVPDDLHPNGEANRRVGEVLSRELLKVMGVGAGAKKR